MDGDTSMNSGIFIKLEMGGLIMKKWDGSSSTTQMLCSIRHPGAGAMDWDGFGQVDLILITSI